MTCRAASSSRDSAISIHSINQTNILPISVVLCILKRKLKDLKSSICLIYPKKQRGGGGNDKLMFKHFEEEMLVEKMSLDAGRDNDKHTTAQ